MEPDTIARARERSRIPGIPGPVVLGGLLCMLGAMTASPAMAAGSHFDFGDVVAKAKKLASHSWHEPGKVPDFLGKLGYSRYEKIQLRPKQWLWSGNRSRFQIGPISPGYLYDHTVKLHVVDRSGVHVVAYDKNAFSYPSEQLRHKIPANLGYAGFQVSYPFGKGRSDRQSLLVFLGATYFRGMARGQRFGASARGIAIDTGLPSGEQFPLFTQYWLVRPDRNARVMQFYALMRGKSLTGAYHFTLYPGRPTRLRVRAVLFTRSGIKLLGVAPLTSMFLYGSNTPRPADNWRPQVHDSDGLLIHNGTGEWLWRPLFDPAQLQTYYFDARNPTGFGLLQRETRFSMYQSLAARYDKRPSIWVQPKGKWGKGHVVLLEIPSDSNNNDNIDAFWSPGSQPGPGRKLDYRYTLTFGGPGITGEPMGHVASTRIGSAATDGQSDHHKGTYHINVDFAGGPLAKLGSDAQVVGVVSPENGGKVLEHYVQYIPPLHQWRLDIVARPAAPGKALRLRAYLKSGKRTLTETWSYKLPPDNGILSASK
ncbi:MAG TPA: glucan biosynthesis protein G [Gammaproteobacteria bacterium]|nr:glucan biosynthesis protein G [Gammaproteobacteria bacterium]